MNKRIRRLGILMIIIVGVGLSWGCAPPAVKLKVSRKEIKQGDPVTVSWESNRAKSVELNGKAVEKIGAESVTPKQTTTFEIVAKRGKKEARDKATVRVNVIVAAAPTINLRAEPSAIESGQSARLRWSTANARTVTITGLGDVAASGERQVNPRVSTTYTGNAVGDGGTAAASARVTVTERAAKLSEPAKPTGKAEPPIAELFGKAVTAVYFEFDKADLTVAAQEKLRRIADWLIQDPHRTISFRIEGNCDPRGTEEYNLGLGDRRARAAKDFLASLGVEVNRIDTISYGLEKAVGDNEGSPDVAPSWAHDRRDDFVYRSGGKQ
ncbi:MAG TPA: OmpA family protein [Blastocatellia bacterium]|nr:OmpA family protein [Blastocatellia bacterium]